MRKMMTKKFAMEEAGEPEHKNSLGMFKKKIKTKSQGARKFGKASIGGGAGALKAASFKSSGGK